MGTKYKNTKKKMASLGLMKGENGDYTYIDPSEKASKYKPIKNK
ncbi:hypothetical protein [Clostridium cylindrosporum]|uniref:Uncharacterized protein n=1 Tax=Clostridium cylindrosporum DSM 605 TaxID=1121307 RepID=A0A0J8D4M6_CLOCY|nr:hypothetical protein [Clostridium cylindrosporum]KMT20772.1 hypothetical protein CLCY_1c00040 [Clostridium cylindrosporum DSM 605]